MSQTKWTSVSGQGTLWAACPTVPANSSARCHACCPPTCKSPWKHTTTSEVHSWWTQAFLRATSSNGSSPFRMTPRIAQTQSPCVGVTVGNGSVWCLFSCTVALCAHRWFRQCMHACSQCRSCRSHRRGELAKTPRSLRRALLGVCRKGVVPENMFTKHGIPFDATPDGRPHVRRKQLNQRRTRTGDGQCPSGEITPPPERARRQSQRQTSEHAATCKERATAWVNVLEANKDSA